MGFLVATIAGIAWVVNELIGCRMTMPSSFTGTARFV